MLIISQDTIGRNFSRVDDGEVIRGYYQYLSTVKGEWVMSTYSVSEKYTNPMGMQVYRKPANILGWLQIMPKLARKYFKKLFGVR